MDRGNTGRKDECASFKWLLRCKYYFENEEGPHYHLAMCIIRLVGKLYMRVHVMHVQRHEGLVYLLSNR